MCVCDTVPNRLYPKNEQTLAVKGHAFISFVSISRECELERLYFREEY